MECELKRDFHANGLASFINDWVLAHELGDRPAIRCVGDDRLRGMAGCSHTAPAKLWVRDRAAAQARVPAARGRRRYCAELVPGAVVLSPFAVPAVVPECCAAACRSCFAAWAPHRAATCGA